MSIEIEIVWDCYCWFREIVERCFVEIGGEREERWKGEGVEGG